MLTQPNCTKYHTSFKDMMMQAITNNSQLPRRNADEFPSDTPFSDKFLKN